MGTLPLPSPTELAHLSYSCARRFFFRSFEKNEGDLGARCAAENPFGRRPKVNRRGGEVMKRLKKIRERDPVIGPGDPPPSARTPPKAAEIFPLKVV